MVKYNTGVINRSTLAAEIVDDTDATMQVSAGDGTIFPPVPFLLVLTPDLSQASLDIAEYVEITDVSTDILTFGDRDIEGQADTQNHPIGTMVVEVFQPRHLDGVHNDITDLEYALGRINGTILTGVKTWHPDYDQLLTVEQDTPDMTVKINAGFGFRDGAMARVSTDYTTSVITAPSANPRKDLVSMDTVLRKIVVTTGVEAAGVPSTPSGHFALAEIDVIVSQSTIVNGDITDVRVHI